MNRVLIAWELGGNWGHLARTLPIALALRSRGHEVHFAVRDVRTAALFLGPHGFAMTVAPLTVVPPTPLAAPENYAGVLWTQGYGERESLRDQVNTWMELIQELQPDVVVADFAPGAMLAAIGAGMPAIPIGSGFEVPPPTHPLPSIRPWQETPIERLAKVDDALLEVMNDVLVQVGADPLPGLSALFPQRRTAVTTFPELDHLGATEGHNYAGPIYCTPPGALRVRWAQPRGLRILAYLRPGTRGLAAMLAELRTMGEVIACIPDLPARLQATLGSSQTYAQPLQLEYLLPEADMMVNNGSLTTSTRALLAGVPVLSLPNVVEQQLGSLRMRQFGAGLIADHGRSRKMLGVLARELLQPSFRRRARQFAQRYANESVSRSVARVITVIEAAARESLNDVRPPDSRCLQMPSPGPR